jgi:ABC-type multidrug transport system ATPase subunit
MLEINSIGFSYTRKGTAVINDCSFSLRTAGRCLIVGSNGSGKSTIMDIMTGFKQPPKGNVVINGIDIYKRTKSFSAASKLISYMPASLRFPNTIGVSSILELYAGPYFAQELCCDLGLDKFLDKKYYELSDGYRTRLALNICLSRGAYIFLDEPLKSQDEELKELFPQLLKKYTAGRTVVISSPHVLVGVEWDSVYKLHNGSVKKC